MPNIGRGGTTNEVRHLPSLHSSIHLGEANVVIIEGPRERHGKRRFNFHPWRRANGRGEKGEEEHRGGTGGKEGEEEHRGGTEGAGKGGGGGAEEKAG
ncbi:hypothetical protein niasHT_010286 [Heterodera trifolii]|uniref:Uncharacterized protein n=1 Tax=Heterodera trifolii TaxID=157864 RepID=A0ABD2M8J6_9BILA